MILETPQDARLYLGQAMGEAEGHGIAGGSAVTYSAPSPKKNDAPNEDAAGLIPLDARSALLVVADGLGGMQAGERASALTLKTLKATVRQAARDGATLRAAILNGIEEANRAVQALGAATTLAIVEVNGEGVRPYHVGDSMILMVGQRGRIKLQTVPHSPVGFAVEAGLLDAAEAMHHEDRHIVSNVLGVADMRIEVGSMCELAPRDTLLIASDGLADNLHVEEITELIRKGALDEAARGLIAAVRERMLRPDEGQPSKPDDLTFVAFRRQPPSRHARGRDAEAPNRRKNRAD